VICVKTGDRQIVRIVCWAVEGVHEPLLSVRTFTESDITITFAKNVATIDFS